VIDVDKVDMRSMPAPPEPPMIGTAQPPAPDLKFPL